MQPTPGNKYSRESRYLNDFIASRFRSLRVLLSDAWERISHGTKRPAQVSIQTLPAVLKHYGEGVKARHRCAELLDAIHVMLDEYLGSMQQSQREKVTYIREALSRIPLHDLKNSTPDLSSISVVVDTADPTYSRLIQELQGWSEDLYDAVHLLIRVHRFVSNINFKIVSSLEEERTYEAPNKESDSLRALNVEMIAYEALLGETIVSSTPSNIQIEPTGRCNARCKPCPLHSPAGRIHPDINPKTISKIPHVLSAAQFVELFALGEPTIAPSFDDIASLCHSNGCETHTITNGTRLLESAALKKMKKIGISYDGDTKEVFESIRIGIDFTDLLKAIRVFRDENPEIFIYLNCTVNRANLLQIPAIAARAKELQMQAVCFHRMFEVEPEIQCTVLKAEDIPIYREKIDEAKKLLEGSGVLLFDYAIVERSPPASEPLDPERSLRTIQSFVPKKDTSAMTVSTMMEKLKKLTIKLYPQTSQIVLPQKVEETSTSTQKHPLLSPTESLLETQMCERSQSAEERVAILRERVRAVGAKGLKLPYCTAAWARLIVKADGRMFPCSCWGRTYANLNQITSFEETWNGEFHQKLRASFHGDGPLHERCKRCPSIDRYQGFTEILQVVKKLGISYEDLPKQEGCNPPPGKLQL